MIILNRLNLNKKLTGQTDDDAIIYAEIMVLSKSVSNFWRTLEMLLINGEINFILAWSANCEIASHTAAIQATTFAIIDTKLYVPVVNLSTEDNAKLQKNWNHDSTAQLIGKNIN